MPTVHDEIVDKGVTLPERLRDDRLCRPSRSSILPGKYSHTTGVHDNGGSNGGFGVFDDVVDDRRSGSRPPATTPASSAST